MSGLLEEYGESTSILGKMQVEFRYIKRKHRFEKISARHWRKKSVLPASYPMCRIAQFSTLLHKESQLEDLLMINDTSMLVQKIKKHSQSDLADEISEICTGSRQRMGISKARNIVINGIVPVLFTLGKIRSMPSYMVRALYHLEHLPAEKNHIINHWNKYTSVSVASESQGFIELKRKFCDKQRCLECPVGVKILR